ncbi:MAG: alpha/beta fold hydrolase [Myxococcota bacterium]
MEKKFLNVAGETLCYVDEGKGPPLVLIHGFIVSHKVWSGLIPRLAQSFRVIAPDLPGHGDSSRPDPSTCPYDAPYLADRVAKLLESLGVSGAGVVGHSMGGKVASYLTARHPDRVSRLLLINSQGLPHPMPLLGKLVLLPVVGKPLFIKGYTRAAVKQYFKSDVFTDPRNVSDEMVDEVYRCLNLPGGRVAAYAMLRHTVVPTPEFPDILRRIKVPVHLVWGELDRIYPLELGRQFQSLLPGATLTVIPGCAHTPPEEQPERTLEEIQRFMTSSETVRSAG